MRASSAFFLVVLMFALMMVPAARGQSLAAADAAAAHGDYAKAVRQLTRLAERNDPNAQMRLGYLYANGYGVPQSFEVAADLYRRSAEGGNAAAQYLLGSAFDRGLGVPRDPVRSYLWLNLAAAGAPPRERDYYARLRDSVASKLTRNEIAYAQRLAVGFSAHRSDNGR